MLPPFKVRNLNVDQPTLSTGSQQGPEEDLPGLGESRHGTIQISGPSYDNLVSRHPDAVLSYMDDDDGEIITVGSSLELSQRLEEPVESPRRVRTRRSLQPTPSRPANPSVSPVTAPLHIFDVDRSGKALHLWRDIEKASRPSTSSWPKDMAEHMGKALESDDALANEKEVYAADTQSLDSSPSPKPCSYTAWQPEPFDSRAKYFQASNPPQAGKWDAPQYPTKSAERPYLIVEPYAEGRPSLIQSFNLDVQGLRQAETSGQPPIPGNGLTAVGKQQASEAGEKLRSALSAKNASQKSVQSNLDALNRWAGYGKDQSAGAMTAPATASLYGAFQDQMQKVQDVSALNEAAEKSKEADDAESSTTSSDSSTSQQMPTNPGEIFAHSIRSVVEGVTLLATDLKESLPEVHDAVRSGTKDVSKTLEESFRDAFGLFNTHIQNVAKAAQEASNFTRDAAEKTRKADLEALETVIEGLGQVAAGFGQIGRNIFSPKQKEENSSVEEKIQIYEAVASAAPTAPNTAFSKEDKPVEQSKPDEPTIHDSESEDESYSLSRNPHLSSNERISLLRNRRRRGSYTLPPPTDRYVDAHRNRAQRRHSAFPYRGYEYVSPSDVELDRPSWAKITSHPTRRRHQARSRSPRYRLSPPRPLSPIHGYQKFGKRGPIHLPIDLSESTPRSNDLPYRSKDRNENLRPRLTVAPCQPPIRPHSYVFNNDLPKGPDGASTRALRHRQSWHPSTRVPGRTPRTGLDSGVRHLPRQEAMDLTGPKVPPKIRQARSVSFDDWLRGDDFKVGPAPCILPVSGNCGDSIDRPQKSSAFGQAASSSLIGETSFGKSSDDDEETSQNGAESAWSYQHLNDGSQSPTCAPSAAELARKLFSGDASGNDSDQNLPTYQDRYAPHLMDEQLSRYPTVSQFEGRHLSAPFMQPLLPQNRQSKLNEDQEDASEAAKKSKVPVSGAEAPVMAQIPGAWPPVVSSSSNTSPDTKPSTISEDGDMYGVEASFKPSSSSKTMEPQAPESTTSMNPFTSGVYFSNRDPASDTSARSHRFSLPAAIEPHQRTGWDSFLERYETTTPGSFPNEASTAAAVPQVASPREPFLQARSTVSWPAATWSPPPAPPLPPVAHNSLPTPRRSSSERSVRFDDQPPAIINNNPASREQHSPLLYSHDDASSVQKVEQCVNNLRQMGFGMREDGTGEVDVDRLVVYAQAADGDLEVALEIIDEERQALGQHER